jgi:hypothetical protein
LEYRVFESPEQPDENYPAINVNLNEEQVGRMWIETKMGKFSAPANGLITLVFYRNN